MQTVMANGREIAVEYGQSYASILKTHFPYMKYVTNVVSDGILRELFRHFRADKNLEFISALDNEEAARTYARGISFLLFRAARKMFGREKKLMIDHALSGGLYCVIEGESGLTPAQVVKLEGIMMEMVQEDTNFIYNKVPKEAAIELFEKDGQMDKVELLKYRPLDYFRYYENEGEVNYFYGQMVPSTRYLKDFKLFYFKPGFIVKYPTPYQSMTPNLNEEPKLARILNQSEQWSKVLKVSYVADINKLADTGGLGDFIKINEALHEGQISDIAKRIVNQKKARIILIAGPSSSGKTTFAGRLSTHLKALKKSCYPISLDDYYLDRDTIPRDENGKQDFETIDALDTLLFNENMVDLLDGKEAKLPAFNFTSGKREPALKRMKIEKEAIIVVEGIHGLNDSLTRLIPNEYKFKVFISPLNTLNIDDHNIVYPEDLRLLRRMVRDRQFRGYTAETTLSMWGDVRRGEYKYILPYQENADVIFNSALIYEPMILKKYAIDALHKIKKGTESYLYASHLMKFLNYFASSDLDDEIPKNSLLREFIGQ